MSYLQLKTKVLPELLPVVMAMEQRGWGCPQVMPSSEGKRIIHPEIEISVHYFADGDVEFFVTPTQGYPQSYSTVHEVIKALDPLPIPIKPAYCYVFIREDLSGPQRIVQSIHASVEALRNNLLPGSPHPHVVLFGVPSQNHLLDLYRGLNFQVPMTLFREPDRNEEATAMASPILSGSDCLIFKRFRLYQGETHALL